MVCSGLKQGSIAVVACRSDEAANKTTANIADLPAGPGGDRADLDDHPAGGFTAAAAARSEKTLLRMLSKLPGAQQQQQQQNLSFSSTSGSTSCSGSSTSSRRLIHQVSQILPPEAQEQLSESQTL